MTDIKSKFNKFFKGISGGNDAEKQPHKMSSNILRKMSLKRHNRFDEMSDHDLSTWFIHDLELYLKATLEPEQYWNNPHPPHKYLLLLAKNIGIAEYQVYVGPIPTGKEIVLRKVVIHSLIDIFKLKNFNGFDLIFKYNKNLKNMNVIFLSWANHKLPSLINQVPKINRNADWYGGGHSGTSYDSEDSDDYVDSDGDEDDEDEFDRFGSKDGGIRRNISISNSSSNGGRYYDIQREIRIRDKMIAMIKLNEILEDTNPFDEADRKPKINIRQWIREGNGNSSELLLENCGSSGSVVVENLN